MTTWTNHLLHFILLLIPTLISKSSEEDPINLFTMNNGYNTGWYGKFCYDLTQYSPTCGWKVIFSINYKMIELQVFESTKEKVDDYTYELTGKSFLNDLTAKPGRCQNINIECECGDEAPVVVSVTFSCVCTDGTGGLCQPVAYTLVPAFGLTTTTPSTTGQPPLSSLVNNNSIKLSGEYNCYTGLSKERLAFSVRDLTECGFFCLEDETCEGINYHSSAKQCDLVSESVSDNDVFINLEPMFGCRFWKVLERT